jgi:hypothetical protein
VGERWDIKFIDLTINFTMWSDLPIWNGNLCAYTLQEDLIQQNKNAAYYTRTYVDFMLDEFNIVEEYKTYNNGNEQLNLPYLVSDYKIEQYCRYKHITLEKLQEKLDTMV